MAEFRITEWNAGKVFTKATNINVVAMTRAAFMVEREVKKSFGTGASRSDVKSRRTKSGKYHRPSAPGFPPNIDAGELKSSIGSEVVKGSFFVDGLVGDTFNLKYAPMLELGTSKMAPRPFLRPALKRLRRKIHKVFKDANGD